VLIRIIGNIASCASLVLSSAVLALVMQCGNVPILLLVGGIAVVWGCIAAAGGVIRREGIADFKISGGAGLFEAFGNNGFRLTVFPAVLMIEPIEAANLSSVWIGGVIVFGLLAIGSQLSVRHVVGCVVFGVGVLVMVLEGVGAGHVLAVSGGLIWAWYLVRSAVMGGAVWQADAIGNLVAGGILIYLSWLVETPWDMGASDLYWLCGVILLENAGYLVWRYGARHGDVRMGKIVILFTPVVTVMWICVLGDVSLNAGHVAATAAVTMAGVMLSPHVFRGAKKACF